MKLNIDYENFKNIVKKYNTNLGIANSKKEKVNTYDKEKRLLLNSFDKNIYSLELDNKNKMMNNLSVIETCKTQIDLLDNNCAEYTKVEQRDSEAFLDYFENLYNLIEKYDNQNNQEVMFGSMSTTSMVSKKTKKKIKKSKKVSSIVKIKSNNKNTKAKKKKKKNVKVLKNTINIKIKIKNANKKKNTKKTGAKKVKNVKVLNKASKVIEYAKKFLGNRYVWGGTSLTNGTDCSGFVQSVYKHFGYNLQRTSSAQSNDSKYKTVSVNNLQPGDLLFYTHGSRIGHVTMYMGNGKVIHASNRKDGIKISSINYRRPVKAKRIIT